MAIRTGSCRRAGREAAPHPPDLRQPARHVQQASAPGEPEIDVYGRDAMVRWGGSTLFLARFDDGWRVTAAGCAPRGEDLPYDCAVEGR